MSRLPASLFALVALLAVGALALTQELRSRADVINSVKVRTIDDGTAGRIRFRLTEPEPRATIAIVDRRGTVVAEPVEGRPLGPGLVRVVWDGQIEPGVPAEPGRYRVRFTLAELDRKAFLPGRIRIEASS